MTPETKFALNDRVRVANPYDDSDVGTITAMDIRRPTVRVFTVSGEAHYNVAGVPEVKYYVTWDGNVFPKTLVYRPECFEEYQLELAENGLERAIRRATK